MSFFKKVAVIFVICSLIFIATSCGGGIEKQVESQFLKFAEMHTGIKYYADDLETVQVATKTKDGITSQIFEVRGTVLSGEEKNQSRIYGRMERSKAYNRWYLFELIIDGEKIF